MFRIHRFCLIFFIGRLRRRVCTIFGPRSCPIVELEKFSEGSSKTRCSIEFVQDHFFAIFRILLKLSCTNVNELPALDELEKIAKFYYGLQFNPMILTGDANGNHDY